MTIAKLVTTVVVWCNGPYKEKEILLLVIFVSVDP